MTDVDVSKEAVERLCVRLCHPHAAFRPSISDARAAADTLRALSARLAEVEAANRGLVRLNEATHARAEAAETRLAEALDALDVFELRVRQKQLAALAQAVARVKGGAK